MPNASRPSARPRAGLLAVTLALGLATAWPETAVAADLAAPLLVEARAKLRKRDIAGALKVLEKAIAADPTNADAHILYQDLARDALGVEGMQTSYRKRRDDKPDEPLLAFLYARLLAPDAAAAEFDKLVLKFPASPWPHAGKARALEAAGKPAEAAAEFAAAVAAAPTDVRFKAHQASSMERAGDWTSALEAWKAVLAAAPGDRAATLGLGEALRRTGQVDAAIATFEGVVKSDATDAEALYRIALAQGDAVKFDEALKSLDAALAIDKLFVEAYCAATEFSIQQTLAVAKKEKRYATEKEFEKALSYGNKAAAVGPDKPDARFALGAAHEAAGGEDNVHYDAALLEYDAALNLLPIPGPGKLRVLLAKSFVLLEQQKFDQAIATADKALGIDDRCVAAYLHAGNALAQQGKQDDAVKRYYNTALKYAPDDARLHHAIGLALWETKHEPQAKKELEQAVKLAPDEARFRLSLGELYYDMKMYKQAGDELFKVVDEMPNYVPAWETYGRVCSQLGNWDQAAESYEKVCAILEKPAAPAGPPPAGGAPEAPAASGGSPVSDQLAPAHLYLAIIYADHLKKRDKAKTHIKRYIELGGSDSNLQSWIDDLLKD